ncbi:hypothetical protein ES705_15381 [subsurface metagenome]
MESEFKIPEYICQKAQHYMSFLLQELKDNGTEIMIWEHFGLELIAWGYHHLVKVTELIEKEELTIKQDDSSTKIHLVIKIQYDYKTELNKLIEGFEIFPGQLQNFKIL